MASTSSPPATGVKLVTENDWQLWIAHIKNIAMENQIWQYINPRHSTEPPEPTEPEKPTAAQITGDPTATTQSLDPTQLSRYSALFSIYQTKRAEYQSFLRARQRIVSLIHDTVADSNQHYLTGIYTPYQKLRKLRSIFAPSPRLYTQQLRVAWRHHFYSVSYDSKSLNRETWLRRTEALYSDCASAGVPEALHKDSLLYDFLTAVRALGYEGFFQSWYQHIFVNNQDIDFYRLIHHLRETLRVEINQQQATNIAFTATLSGQPTSGSTTAPKPRSPCVYGADYPYKRCYYLVPNARPPAWQPRQDTVSKINDLLAKDTYLFGQVKKAVPNLIYPIVNLALISDLPTETIAF